MDSGALVQGTEEWLRARAGSLGASQVQDAIAKTKSGWGASRASVMANLIVERLTGEPIETYQSAAMRHGIETEPEARAAYCFFRDVEVEEVGLIKHPKIKGTHASPDGLVGANGVLELKCPQPAAHLAFLLDGKIPGKYITQIYWQLACTGRDWADFVSYSPHFPADLSLFVKRVERDHERVKELEAMVIEFLVEVSEKLDQLRALQGDALPEAALREA